MAAWHAGDEALQLLTQGISRRHTGETRTNATSSRSHCVFVCVLESRAVEDGIASFRTSRLHLVDLAGGSDLGPLQPEPRKTRVRYVGYTKPAILCSKEAEIMRNDTECYPI